MDVSSFFSRLVQPAKGQGVLQAVDDPGDFDAAWKAIQEILEHPDERQIVRGIASTDVPSRLRHIVDALVYEDSRTNGDETGACFEYLIRNDLLATLVKLSETDRPHGIKGEVVRSLNNLIVLLSDRFLNHNAVHGPLRRLLRSCVGDEPVEGRSEGVSRVFGAAGMEAKGRGWPRNEEAEADLVDLMCVLCSKMRAYPPLLLIFFHDKVSPQPGSIVRSDSLLARTLSPTPSTQTRPSTLPSSTKSGQQRFEFLLFSYLLRFVHREGRTGDFARAGLLFLFDIAFLPAQDFGDGQPDHHSRKGENDTLQDAQDALGEYILDGDFAAVMAAALGAVYSLLPSKLRVPTLAEQAGGGGEADEASASGGLYLGAKAVRLGTDQEPLPCTTDPDVRSQLDLLLKLFAFLQDIITRCSSSAFAATEADITLTNTHILGAAVSDAALDAIQSSFLDNIIYPSILESSAVDGTSVAVMTYLHVVLTNIDDGPLLTRLLHFLLDTDLDEGPRLAPHHQPKRGSISFSVETEGGQLDRTDYFGDTGKFTLKDLILDNLSCDNSASRTAALQLLQTMLQEHCASAVDGLLSVSRLTPNHMPSQAAFPPELTLYSDLLASLHPAAPSFDQSPSYAAYLVDIQSTIQSDRCFRLGQLDDAFADESERLDIARAKRKAVPRHRVTPEDPMMREIMLGLAGWMGRSADENLLLVSVVISLASCSRRCLDGWLTMASAAGDEADPWSAAEPPAHAPHTPVGGDPFTSPSISHTTPSASANFLPALYQLLRSQTTHIAHLQRTIPNFDRLLAERRHGLLFADNLDEAMALNLEMETFGSVPSAPASLAPPPTTPAKKGRASLARSITGFFSPRKGTPGGSSPSGVGVGVETPVTPDEGRSGSVGDETNSMKGEVTKDGVDVVVEASPISEIVSGPWAVQTPRRPGATRTISEWSREDDAGTPSFSQSRGVSTPSEGENDGDSRRTVELDQILDNVVILEEFLKEIVAVITVRRALRIDPVEVGH